METSITKNVARIGSFTSSEIWKLMTRAKDGKSPGKPFLDYVAEKNMERRLGRSVDSESNAKPLIYGKLVEHRVFDILGLEYRLCSQETIVHETIPYWCGSPDGEKHDGTKTVLEIKSPMTLKSFCQFVDSGNIDCIRENHKDGEAYFWQCISNAILLDCQFAELIVYAPFLKELPAIRELASDYKGNANRVAWVNFAEDDELPWIPNSGHYNNINIFRWQIEQADRYALTNSVLAAGTMLEEPVKL